MSRRRSTGELVPRDITEILAQEARTHRGQRKTSGSLGQALSWLKGSRRKKAPGNGLNRSGVTLTDTKLGFQNIDTAKVGPKGHEDQKKLSVHFTAVQHYQENVFIEGNRPQYLEDLHSEAQEGLKIQQQEEHKNRVNIPDDGSVASTDTVRPEQDAGWREGAESPGSRSTEATITAALSTRPTLIHQSSTFKPLNPVKTCEKRKRCRRTTIMGIPNQVQKELARHKSSTFQQAVSSQVRNHDDQANNRQSGSPGATEEGVRVRLSELEAPGDAQHFSQQRSGNLCPTFALRPKSVAVPGTETVPPPAPSAVIRFLQELQGPVMSISPQATYLSTIIPNAILPASIDVIEIDRSISRTCGSNTNQAGSVRTVSKSSLGSGDSSSPVLSRSDGGDFHLDNSFKSTTIPASDSRPDQLQRSRSSTQHSSPVLSKETRASGQESQEEEAGLNTNLLCVHDSVSMISNSSCKSESLVTYSDSAVSAPAAAGEERHTKQSCSRSLSVVKPKLPPPPPQRTNSLHSNKTRSNITVLVDGTDPKLSAYGYMEAGEITSGTSGTGKIQTNAGSSSSDDSRSSASSTFIPIKYSSGEAGGPAEPQTESSSSSPQKTPSEGAKFERTLSPSSGYSSQSGTPTLSPKGISPTSPDKQKKKPVKPERSVSRASSAASPSSSPTFPSCNTSEPVGQDVSASSPKESPTNIAMESFVTNHSSSNVPLEITGFLKIPPPPKVRAPCAPPPETWIHNKHTVDLLCGSYPNLSTPNHKPGQTEDNKETETPTETEDFHILPKNKTNADKPLGQLTEKTGVLLTESVHIEVQGRKGSGDQKMSIQETRESVGIQRQDKDMKSQETSPKKCPPPVMKKPTVVLHTEQGGLTEKSAARQQKDVSGTILIELHLVDDNQITSSQNSHDALGNGETQMEKHEVTSMQTLSVEIPKVPKVSPPPTPPPAYHPTPPPSRKSPPSSVSTIPSEIQRVQEDIQGTESCWPPPPPPLEGDSVFDGGDEIDFPPPPPCLSESLLNVVDSYIASLDVTNKPTVATDVQEIIQDSGETNEVMNEQNTDSCSLQTAVNDIKPDGIEQVSQPSCVDDVSQTEMQNASPLLDAAANPPAETTSPPSPPAVRVEEPSTPPALDTPSCLVKPYSIKTKESSSAQKPDIEQFPTPICDPVPPTQPLEIPTPGVNFRRQPTVATRESSSKELHFRHKGTPASKEDASIPLVTPSLLQMVRLRSVNMTEDQANAPSTEEPTIKEAPIQDTCPVSSPASQNIPQKPIRKSLSLKSSPQSGKTSSVMLNMPSMRLQEAIRMKTAAMSSRDCVPSRLGLRSSSCMSEPGTPFSKSSEGHDLPKSPASTASFIFSKSTKKVVIETVADPSPQAQTSLKQSLVAELIQVAGQSKTKPYPNGGVNSEKVPPPVAKKPTHITGTSKLAGCSTKTDISTEGKGDQHVTQLKETTTRVTADTIETLF